MAFPLPKLLPRIEELLQEVQWLDGLILITDSDRTCFCLLYTSDAADE